MAGYDHHHCQSASSTGERERETLSSFVVELSAPLHPEFTYDFSKKVAIEQKQTNGPSHSRLPLSAAVASVQGCIDSVCGEIKTVQVLSTAKKNSCMTTMCSSWGIQPQQSGTVGASYRAPARGVNSKPPGTTYQAGNGRRQNGTCRGTPGEHVCGVSAAELPAAPRRWHPRIVCGGLQGISPNLG